MKRSIVAFSLVLLPLPASAAPPFYFSKPGIAAPDFAADVLACRELVNGVRAPPQSTIYSPNAYAAATGAFLSGLLRSRERRKLTESVLRTCMADKGYRRVEMTSEIETEVGHLDDVARTKRLHRLASATPTSERVLPR